MRRGTAYDIALVGMGCQFPGAPDLFAFWANTLANRDMTCKLPPQPWPLDGLDDPGSDANHHSDRGNGGCLDSPIRFDPVAQEIMPIAMERAEPEEFLVLDAAQKALVDASVDLDRLDRRRVEVVIGRGNHFSRGNLIRLQHGRIIEQTIGLLAAIHPEWTTEDLDLIRHDLKASLPAFEAVTIPGHHNHDTAGRLANQLDLSGASFVVDAASASALVALELGSKALIGCRADLVLVGGVHAPAPIGFRLDSRRLDLLSRSGVAAPLSTEADGFIPGEGVGILVLRRLRDALRAGNRIYAVLKGVGISGNGQDRGITSTCSKDQARAIRRAYRAAGIDPASVGLIEGHGLGVSAADRAELRAIGRVFGPPLGGSRALSAASSQIGHATPAAAMAGLIRTALALHHRVLPPTKNAEASAPQAAENGLELIASARPWVHGDKTTPRRAGVNAFGSAGVSAHAVLEEHSPSADGLVPGALLDWDTEAFLLSAPDPVSLADRLRWLRERLPRGSRHSLKDLAFTINTLPPGQNDWTRLGLVAASQDELVRHLEAIEPKLRDASCRHVRDARGLYYWTEPLGCGGSLAFLFPGEGSQYPGMLADLCPHFPELRQVLDAADRISLESGEGIPPSKHLFGAIGPISEAFWATDTAVTAVLSSQWAIFQVLSRIGLRPRAVCGHSSGELPALAAAGALQSERVLERQLIRLATIFRELESRGAIPRARLAAVGTNREKAESACRRVSDSVVVAIDNCPHQVVLAGLPGEVDRVVAELRTEGIICEDLPFARAYHTRGFSAVVEPLAAFYESLELRRAQIPIYSCSTGERITDSADEILRLAVEQWTRPVRFRDTVETMYRDGIRIFVDVGARGNLCGYVEDILRGRPSFAVAANLPRRSGTAQLNHLVASLFAHGVCVDPSYLYARRRPRRIDLDATPTPAQRTLSLAVGFPTMKLSADVVRRLRHRSGLTSSPEEQSSLDLTGSSSEPSPQARKGACASSGRYRVNGHVTPERLPDLLASPSPALPALERIERSLTEISHELEAAAQEGDQVMLGFLETMTGFLSTQREVMEAYFQRPGRAIKEGMDSEPESSATQQTNSVRKACGDSSASSSRSERQIGPWVGTIKEWEPGRRIVAHRSLAPTDDPVAENHTLGGRRVSTLAPELKGLPVLPFSVMAEMIAQVSAMIMPPCLVLESLQEVRALKWVQFDRDGFLEIQGQCHPTDPASVCVTMHHLQGTSSSSSGEGRLVFEGSARFAEQPLEPLPASELVLLHPRPSKFTSECLYNEQWLFHGPPMQGLTHVAQVSPDGISGTITVRPLAGLLRPGQPSAFHTDPIVLDTFTHLLGCWGLDCLSQGDVIFPLRMGRLSIHGASPEVGTPIECRIQVRRVERRHISVDAELVRPDGRVWMQIHDWEDWRFYWPARYRDVFRAPDTILLGEQLPLRDKGPQDAVAVWLAPPGDMARPVWRDVLEQIQLAPDERALCLKMGGSELARTHRLWSRIAAKEAVRRLWLAEGRPARYPADLAIVTDSQGRPRLLDLAQPQAKDMPAVSIAHTEGIVVALAAREASSPVGIDLEPACERSLSLDTPALTPSEGAMLRSRVGPEGWMTIARLLSAKQAAAKASGLGPGAEPAETEVVALDPGTGDARVALSRAPASATGDLTGTIRVHTEVRGNYVWAWTLGERTDNP
jgi:acyl transferase domain-containing protein